MSDDEKIGIEVGFRKALREDQSYITADVEKANIEYYEEQQGQTCCRLACAELCAHPYTVLEVTGRVIDIRRSFALQPWWIVFPLKCVPLGLAVDTLVRGLATYDGVVSFYFAYFENWCLLLNIFYFLVSASTSLLFCFKLQQPLPGYNRAPCHVCAMWSTFPIAVVNSMLSVLAYWIFYAGEEGTIFNTDYFVVMKYAVIPVLLVLEGQILNRIPIRFAHLIWSQIFTIVYIIWTLFHSVTTLGNPDIDPDGENLPIYSFLSWNDPEQRASAALGCAIVIAVIAPLVFIFLYLVSWPRRRYCPIEEIEETVGMPDEIDLYLYSGSLGISFIDEPPIIQKIKESSPYAEASDLNPVAIVEGMAIDTFTDATGITYYQMSSDELMTLLSNSKEDEGRQMRLINPKKVKLTKMPGFEGSDGSDVVELTLPAGRLGAAFHDTPPMITRIADDSPLQGEVEVGMVVDTLELEDGTKMYEMTATDFVEALSENIDSDMRVVRFINLETRELTPTPDAEGGEGDDVLEIDLPSGSIGLVFSKGSPATVKAIRETSPLLYSGIVEGMIVDTLELEDGSMFSMMSGKELTAILREHKESDGRKIRFINPFAEMSKPVDDEMPEALEVILPSGKIGLMLDGEPPEIQDIHPESPLLNEGVMIGMVADTLELEDGSKFYNMETSEFQGLLADNAESDERIVRFINPATTELSSPDDEDASGGMPDEVEVILPAGKIGARFVGSPPELRAISPESPIVDEVMVGMVADTLTLEDGEVMYEMSSDELQEALMANKYSEERVIRFINPETMELTPNPEDDIEGEGEPIFEMPDETDVYLPSGKIGLMLQGAPPKITSISPRSPIINEVVEGMVVDTLTLEDGQVMYEMDTETFTGLLREHEDSEDRLVRFINPATVELTPTPPVPDEVLVEDSADSIDVELPPGRLGVSFQMIDGCVCVKNVRDGSPLAGMELDGYGINTLTIGDRLPYMELDAVELTDLLKESKDEPYRVINFMKLSLAHKFDTISDEEIVTLPAGRLGVNFDDHPPKPNKFKPGSPVEPLFPTKMYIDEVQLPNGYSKTGLDVADVVEFLRDNMDEEGRTFVFKSEGIPPSPPSEYNPDLSVVGSLVRSPTSRSSLASRSVASRGASRSVASRASKSVASRASKSVTSRKSVDESRTSKSVASRTSKKSVASRASSKKSRRSLFSRKSGGSATFDENDLNVKQSLTEMGFDSKDIDNAINYFKSAGEPVDADNCMTRIITDG